MPATELIKPHYLFRPRQAIRRIAHLFGPPPDAALVMLPWGLPLRVDPSEDIGRAVWQLGLLDLMVCETLWRLTDPGDLAVDVGANLGQMTGLLALRAGPAGRVLAFEPHPEIFADLTGNADLLRRSTRTAPVELFEAAAADTPGTLWLDPGEHFAGNHGLARLSETSGNGVPVSATTLDLVLDGRSAGMIKIDVEGHEQDVLRGAEASLSAGRIRHLICETGTREEQRALEVSLTGRGYTIFTLGRSFFGPVLGPACDRPRLPHYEAPSCLATRDPDEAVARLRPRGWRVLSRATAH